MTHNAESDAAGPHACDTGWFDRSLCPEPCGAMHSYCSRCGALQDACPFEDVPVSEWYTLSRVIPPGVDQ